MTPQRPALAEVLAAITGRPVGHWRAEVASPAFLGVERISSRDVQWTVRVDPFRATTQTRRATLRSTEPAYEARRIGNTLTRVEVAPAHTIAPAEAVEALATARLWPWEPGEGPRWRCEACCGCGGMDGIGGYVDCDACASTGDSTAPPTLAALVAVASLGAPQLARYVHLAGEIARAAGCAGAVVVWRVMTRAAITEHHARSRIAWWSRLREYGGSIDPTLPEIFSAEEDISHWRSELRWRSRTVGRAAWPALRSLAIGDEATPQPTGVHLLALDASRIVLAVEAL